jgi:hypothetical protein
MSPENKFEKVCTGELNKITLSTQGGALFVNWHGIRGTGTQGIGGLN